MSPFLSCLECIADQIAGFRPQTTSSLGLVRNNRPISIEGLIIIAVACSIQHLRRLTSALGVTFEPM